LTINTLQIKSEPVGSKVKFPKFLLLIKSKIILKLLLPSLLFFCWTSTRCEILGKSTPKIVLKRGTNGQIPSFLASSGDLKPS